MKVTNTMPGRDVCSKINKAGLGEVESVRQVWVLQFYIDDPKYLCDKVTFEQQT